MEIAHGSSVRIRQAQPEDARAIADVHLAARRAAAPAIPPPLLDDEATLAHFATEVLPNAAVWVIDDAATGIVAFMSVTHGLIGHLHVHPDRCRQGHGAVLLDLAKAMEAQLDVWTFGGDEGVRRFFARHGFVEVDRAEGAHVTGVPDLRLRWTRPATPPLHPTL